MGRNAHEVVITSAVFTNDDVAPRRHGEIVRILDHGAVVGFDEKLERRGLVTLGHASLKGTGPVAPDLTLSGLTTIRAGDEDFLVTVPDAFAPGEPRGTRLEAPLAQIVIWRFDVLHVEPLDLHLDAGLHPPAPEVTGVEARITPYRKGLQTTTFFQFTVRIRQEAVKEPIGHVLSLVDDAGGRVYGHRLVPETTHSRQRGRRYRKPLE